MRFGCPAHLVITVLALEECTWHIVSNELMISVSGSHEWSTCKILRPEKLRMHTQRTLALAGPTKVQVQKMRRDQTSFEPLKQCWNTPCLQSSRRVVPWCSLIATCTNRSKILQSIKQLTKPGNTPLPGTLRLEIRTIPIQVNNSKHENSCQHVH